MEVDGKRGITGIDKDANSSSWNKAWNTRNSNLQHPIPTMESEQNTQANETANTPKVTGIGGVFFFSDNPQQLREWYVNNLGIDVTEWGSSSFKTRDVDTPETVNTTEWMPFKTGDKYFEPSRKEFMINYRVQHLEALVDQLRSNGVTILDDIATYDYGKFVHIMDDEGNKIELWEPAAE